MVNIFILQTESCYSCNYSIVIKEHYLCLQLLRNYPQNSQYNEQVTTSSLKNIIDETVC